MAVIISNIVNFLTLLVLKVVCVGLTSVNSGWGCCWTKVGSVSMTWNLYFSEGLWSPLVDLGSLLADLPLPLPTLPQTPRNFWVLH